MTTLWNAIADAAMYKAELGKAEWALWEFG